MNSPESRDPKTPAQRIEATPQTAPHRSTESDAERTRDESEQVEQEDAMLDVLLGEVLESQSPPEQTRVILSRLNEPVTRSRVKKSARKKRRTTSPWMSLFSTAALVLVAASVVLGIRYRNEIGVASKPSQTMPGEAVGNSPPGSPSLKTPSLAPQRDQGDGLSVQADQGRGDLPSRRMELAEADPTLDATKRDPMSMLRQEDRSGATASIVTGPKPSARELTLVSASVTEHLQRYWQRLGLQPTDQRPADEIVTRLHAKLGIEIPEDAVGDTESLLRALKAGPNARALAARVLSAITSRPVDSLTRPSDQQRLAEISETLCSDSGFDSLYVSWFAPRRSEQKTSSEDSPNSSQKAGTLTTPIGELLAPLDEHSKLVTTAAVALNADMRCQRCHDLNSGETDLHRPGEQHDYWQFAATVGPLLGIASDSESGWFYDTPDGRRRFVERAAESTDWAERLTRSDALAEGIVAAMWSMVHGRPLMSGPYDLTGGAEESDLQRIRDELAGDLIAHDFDLLRTISLMLTDSILGRRTPAAMTSEGVLLASDLEWMRAVATVESFAASPPDSMPSTRRHRLQLVQNSDLPTLNASQASAVVLAQPLGDEETGAEQASSRKGTDSGQPAKTEPSPAVLAGLPMRSTVVMPAWINELPDFDSRLQHIAHLAGWVEIPESARQLAMKMQAAKVDEALILQRIWWIIRPQG